MDKKFKLGFAKDENNLKLNEVFENNKKLNVVYIDIYKDNPIESSMPFALLLRALEKNVVVLNDGHRMALKMSDRFETYIMNILLSDINECFVKMYGRNNFEFILNVQNIWYRITIIN